MIIYLAYFNAELLDKYDVIIFLKEFMKMRRKLIQALILAFLFITAIPLNTLAQDDYLGYSKNNDGSINKFYDIDKLMDESRKTLVYLNKNVETTKIIQIVEGTTSKINLNGYSFSKKERYDSGAVFSLNPNSTLELSGNKDYQTFKKNDKEVSSGGLVSGYNAYNGGAIVMKEGSTLSLTDVALAFNGAQDNGSAIYVGGKNCEIYMYNSKVCYNNAESNGTIYINAENCYLYMDNSSIYDNDNSGIYINDNNATIRLEKNSSIKNNNSRGIYANYSWFNISSKDKTAVISDHTNTSGNGAGIYVNSKTVGSNCAVISGITFKNNKALNGGALCLLQNNTQVVDCTFDGNEATDNGGAIYNYGKNSIENSTIINNVCKSEGGGIYANQMYDITLKGKLTINNNKRKDGAKDDVFLRSEPAIKAYILADNIDENSLIGIRSDIEGDRLLVKNLSSFESGNTFFLDQTDYHLGFQSGSKELWQRSGSTTYSVKVNGIEVGKYSVGAKVTVVDNNTDDYRVFKNWADNEVLSDKDSNDKKEDTISFTMPARNVDLKAEYTYYATDLILDVSYPNTDANFPTSAVLTYKVNGVEKKYTLQTNNSFKWYKQVAYTTSSGTIYRTQPIYFENKKPVDGTAYVCYASIYKDRELGMLFSPKMKTTDMKVRFGGNDSYCSDVAKIAVDSWGTLVFISDTVVTGKDTITSITDKPSLTIYGSKSVDELTYSINSYLYRTLDNKVTGHSSLNKDYKLEVNQFKASDLKQILPVDENGKVKNGTYNLTLNLNQGYAANVKGVDLNGNTSVNMTVTLESNTATYMGSLLIFTDNDKTKDQLLSEVPSNVTVYDKTGNSYNVIVDRSTLEDQLKDILNDGKVNIQDDQRVEVSLPFLKPDGVDIDLSSARLNIKVVKGTEPDLSKPILPFLSGSMFNLASENDIMLTSDDETESSDYYLDNSGDLHIVIRSEEGTTVSYKIDDGDEIYCNSNSCELTLSNDKAQYNVKAWANKDNNKSNVAEATYYLYTEDGLDNPTFLTAQGVYTVSDYNGNNVTLDGDTLKLKVEFETGENIKYILVKNDETYAASQESYTYDSEKGIILEAKKGETNAYYIVAFTTQGDRTSEGIVGYYVVDNNQMYSEDSSLELDITMDEPVAGKKLASYLTVNALNDDGSDNPIVFDDVKYLNETKNNIADYSTSYLAQINLGSASEYGISNAGEIKDGDYTYLVSDVNVIVNDNKDIYSLLDIEDGNLVLTILFPMTGSEVSYDLVKVNDLTYDEISYERALALNKVEYGQDIGYTVVDNYNLPSRVSVTLDNGDSDVANITWDKKFKVDFDPNNYNGQELVVEGTIELPGYVNIPDNLSNRIALRIKVKAKQGYVPEEVIDNSTNKVVTCEEYMKSKDWTWSETKKACVYKVSNTASN